MTFAKFLRDWTLIIAILAGIAGYFIFTWLPLGRQVHALAHDTMATLQPMLIFAMLFLTFCKIDPRHLRVCKWHLWLLLIQCGFFTAIGCVLIVMPHSGMRVILEGAMICLICPTATAGAVITRKLGGDVNNITTYTVMINLAAAVLIPSLVPLVHPNPQLSALGSALLILCKVFPLLLFPLLSAMLLRVLCPSLTQRLASYQDVSFYLWAIALTLAIAATTRSIAHCTVELSVQLWLVAVSLACCIFQFWLGRKIGARYNDTITAGQAFGQKNTVLAIWIGYTFFTPITAIAGGFYSIWHNVINSYQLYEHKKSEPLKQESAS